VRMEMLEVDFKEVVFVRRFGERRYTLAELL
jgi:hypothetical protein